MASSAIAPSTPPPITDRTPAAVCSESTSAPAMPMPWTNRYAETIPAKL